MLHKADNFYSFMKVLDLQLAGINVLKYRVICTTLRHAAP